MTIAVLREVQAAGGMALVNIRQSLVLRELYRTATREGMLALAHHEVEQMKGVDAYVGIRGSQNASEYADVPPEQMALFRRHWYGPVHMQIRMPHTRWVVLRFPNPAMAQQAGMSNEGFEDHFLRVCALDYPRLSKAMDPLKALMERTDRVRITGPETDLSFSIKGMPAVKCDGRQNLPDGELFTAPLRESVEGKILFNTSTVYGGIAFNRIRLHFRGGKVVESSAEPADRLNELLDHDEGARRVGEFSLSFNPLITRPISDVLFDEKIAGAFHLALGQSYRDADNGNHSNIHWDLVMLQDSNAGGGRIYFDDRLIRQDGRFVLPELEGLNPENLQ